MYKCSECGTEYETAPKYCECGNDIFINVEDEQDFVPQEAEDFDDEPEMPVRTSKYHGGGRNFRQKNFSPVGLSIFAVCIILSLLVLFVIANPKKEIAKITAENETAEKIEIPSIDSYWDNTPVKTAQKEEVQTPKQENIIDKIVQQIVPQQQPKKEVVQVTKTPSPAQKKVVTPAKTQTKTVQKQTTQKTSAPQKQTTAKIASKPTTSNQSGMTFGDLTNKIRNQYPAQNTQTQTPQKQQTSQTANATKQSAPLPQTSTKTTTNVQTSVQVTPKTQTQSAPKPQTQTQTQTASVPVTPQKSQAQLRQELATYKSALRNAIGRKIDFTRVIGDGDCALSFRINSNGRLTSKAFVKQSSNITLNDAVFNALNTMTSYNPPPEGYNGETLRLTIKFYNGNFEISLN